MIDEIRKQLPEHEIVTVSEKNFEQVFEVYDTNQDFFLLTQGKEATIESSINDINSVSPNFDISQKTYISLWQDGSVVAVLDLLKGYPAQEDIWIGLLLIHGDLHGKKIGSRIITAVLNAAKIVGYRAAQLGVIENNVKALAFWQKQGFEKIRTKENIVVMKNLLLTE